MNYWSEIVRQHAKANTLFTPWTVAILLCFSGFFVSYADTLELLEVLPVGPPEVHHNRITYTVNLRFVQAPLEYWVHYEQSNRKLILEVYGAHIRAQNLAITGTSLFDNPEVKNLSTTMSLAGLRSQILISLDESWHIESSTPDQSTIQLKLWKDLKPKVMMKKPKRNPLFMYLISLAGVTVTTFFVILLTNLDT